jgi:hypothetical protein
MYDRSAIATFSALLQESHARPKVRIERLARSAIYDLEYRVFVVAAAFERHAEVVESIGRRIRVTKLKLLQFVTIRPRLLPFIQEWSTTKQDEEHSFTTEELRRGFHGDRTFDNVVAFLVASGTLKRMGQYVVEGENAGFLTAINNEVNATGLFDMERKTLEALGNIKITVRMEAGK